MNIKLYKPSMAITSTMPMSNVELSVFDYIMKKTYDNLKDEVGSITILEVSEISQITNRNIASKERLKELVDNIFKNEYRYNILGKDKSIKAKVKGRFISDVIEYTDNKIGVVLSELLLERIKMMVTGLELKEKEKLEGDEKKKEEIKKEYKNLKLFYTKIETAKYDKIKFYPSRVVYQILEDYNGTEVPEMKIDDFKEMTNTSDKYQKDYSNKVLKKIVSDLKKIGKNIDFEIGRKSRKIDRIKIVYSKSGTKQSERKDMIKRYLEGIEVKYIKDLNKMQKDLLNITLKARGYAQVR